jgi:uncharacterized membrane protein HdeD (DUF308 family)
MRPSDKQQIVEMYSRTLLFLGISLAVLGVVAILTSVFFTIGTVLVLGGVLVAAGVVECIHAFKAAKQQKKVILNVLSALLYFCVGGLLLWNPIVGALSLTLVISAYLFLNGVLSVALGIRHRKEPLWGWFIAGGIVDLILGTLIATGWPATALWIIGLFVGIEMLMYGASWIAMSFAFKEIEKELQQRSA